MPRAASERGRPLRILLLNERCHLNPLAGGAETHLFEVFGRLAPEHAQVELLCSGFDGASAIDEHRGVRISRVGSRLSYYRHVAREVRRREADGAIDLIVEAHNKIPFLTPLYTRVPVLVLHHHLHGWTAFRQVSAPIAAASVVLEALIPRVYRDCSVLTISKSSKSDLVRRGLPEEHVDVVPCGIDHEHYRAGRLSPRSPTILSLGRLEPYKRIDLLLRSMSRTVAKVPDARLVLVGRGQQEAALRTLTRSLGLEARVTFAGFVPEVEKVRLLQQASLLVQCSKKEGWGLTVSEAYACGTPVVATDVPGLADSVQDGVTGLLVRKPTPRALAAPIVRLLTDEERRSRMAHRALTWAREFTWDESARAVLAAALTAAGWPLRNESNETTRFSSTGPVPTPEPVGVLP